MKRKHALRRYQNATCKDCGLSTTSRVRHTRIRMHSWEWYMVHDDLWAEAGMTFPMYWLSRATARPSPSVGGFLGQHVRRLCVDTQRLAARKLGQLELL